MGLRFSKIIKLTDNIKINLNKKSVSTTLRIFGININLSSKTGVSVSTGLPGTGISYRLTNIFKNN